MDLFKEVRERADILRVCEVLGIKLNRNYKAICPFSDHKEKTASFSIHPSKNIFCCFGCGKKGNSITLVQEMLNLSPLESAKYINDHLGLGLNPKERTSYFVINKYKTKNNSKNNFKEWEQETFELLCEYYKYLGEVKQLKNPRINLYIDAIKEIDYIDYVIDEVFIYGSMEDKLRFKREQGKLIQKIKDTFEL